MKLIKHNSTDQYFIPLLAVYVQPVLKNLKTMGFYHVISMKTLLVQARAVILVLLIFSSAIETGALARTLNSMKPPAAPGATTKVYDPNSNRPVAPSSPNCATYTPGHCKGRNWYCFIWSCLYILNAGGGGSSKSSLFYARTTKLARYLINHFPFFLICSSDMLISLSAKTDHKWWPDWEDH